MPTKTIAYRGRLHSRESGWVSGGHARLRGELKETVNETVDPLRAFSSEVIRVAREVGAKESWAAKQM